MSITNETNGILTHYEWREGKTLFCKNHLGEVFRSKHSYETLTGNHKKALFVKANNLNGTLYERKIKKIKVGIREPAEITLSIDDTKEHTKTLKQFKSNKPKTRYEVIGYHFTPFPPKPRAIKSKIDKKPFIERFAHASYKRMLLADMKLIFNLKREYPMELNKFLSEIQMCYKDNLESPSEIDQFIEIVRTLIETAKTPSGKQYFEVREEENQTFVYKN